MTELTETSAAVPRRTVLVRTAGVLFVISALALAIKEIVGLVQEYQSLGYGDDSGFSLLLPMFALIGLEAAALIVAFLILAFWCARPLPRVMFLVLAIAIPTGFVVEPSSTIEPSFDLVHAFFAVVVGIYILVRGVFGRLPDILFLVSMTLFALKMFAGLSGILYSTLWGETAAGCVLAVSYAVFGIALAARSRAKTTSTTTA